MSLVAAVALYAMLRGGQPERWCAGIIIAGVLADRLIHFAVGQRAFDGFDLSRFLLDASQMVAFFVVALRANRVYPLAISSAQFIVIIGSLSVIFVIDGWNYAYWAMTQLPLFLQLFFLAVGTIAHRWRVARVGRYNGWSYSKSGRVDPA